MAYLYYLLHATWLAVALTWSLSLPSDTRCGGNL